MRVSLMSTWSRFPALIDPEVHPQSEDYWGHVNPIGPRACYDEGKRVAETMCYAYMKQVPNCIVGLGVSMWHACPVKGKVPSRKEMAWLSGCWGSLVSHYYKLIVLSASFPVYVLCEKRLPGDTFFGLECCCMAMNGTFLYCLTAHQQLASAFICLKASNPWSLLLLLLFTFLLSYLVGIKWICYCFNLNFFRNYYLYLFTTISCLNYSLLCWEFLPWMASWGRSAHHVLEPKELQTERWKAWAPTPALPPGKIPG